MRRFAVGSVTVLVGLVAAAGLAGAQPYPYTDQPPPPAPMVVDAPDGGVAPAPSPEATGEYLPDGDYDPDIDGYTVEREVVYDNTVADQYDDGYDPNAYTQFQDALAPYGEWVNDSSYGYVWSPSVSVVGTDFFPYASSGHWVLTDYGWTWVSDWDWGWAPFHYGRWVTLFGRGWCWVPGTQWGPAWVAWRSGGGYVGYAPLPPRGGRIPPPVGPRGPWRFVVAHNLGARRMAFLPSHVVPSVFSRTSVISNARSIHVGGGNVRVNFGPTGIMPAGTGVGMSTPVTLRNYAPMVMPRATIAPRPGMSISQRPWAYGGGSRVTASRPIGIGGGPPPASIPIGTRPYTPPATGPRPMPVYSAPTYTRPAYPAYTPPATAPAPVRTAPGYTPPMYHAPAPVRTAPPSYAPPSYAPPSYAPPSYHAPTYHAPAPPPPTYSRPAPAPTYSAPSYSRPAPAPAPTYSAPSYSRPAPSYSPPSYSRPAPSFSAPAPSRPSSPPPAPSAPSRSAPSRRR